MPALLFLCGPSETKKPASACVHRWRPGQLIRLCAASEAQRIVDQDDVDPALVPGVSGDQKLAADGIR